MLNLKRFLNWILQFRCRLYRERIENNMEEFSLMESLETRMLEVRSGLRTTKYDALISRLRHQQEITFHRMLDLSNKHLDKCPSCKKWCQEKYPEVARTDRELQENFQEVLEKFMANHE